MKDYANIPNTSGAFPDVVSQNATGPGETDGTPYLKDVVDDLWGARQDLMSEAGLSPNGVSEAAGSSQSLQALKTVIQNALCDVQTRNWQHADSSDPGNDVLYDICFGRGYWTAVGSTAGDSLQVSKGGTVFAAVTNPAAATLYGVGASPDHVVAVGAAGALIYCTNPAGTWTDNSSGISTSGADLVSVSFGNNIWTAIDTNGYAYTATDPTGTWTQRSTPASSNSYPLEKIRYISDLSLWIAVGAYQTSPSFSGIITATDPTSTWTERTNPVSTNPKDICFNGENVIIAGGQTVLEILLISADGINYTSQTGDLPDSGVIEFCAADPNGWVIIIQNSQLWVSRDNCSSWALINDNDGYDFVAGYYATDLKRYLLVGDDDIFRSLVLA